MTKSKITDNTIALPIKLRKNGFDYELVLRGKKALIYSQRVSENVTYYEVFRMKISRTKTIQGKIIPPHERFPRDEDFGKWAWTYRSYDKALRKFHDLENENSCAK